jgi:hypothetical protein
LTHKSTGKRFVGNIDIHFRSKDNDNRNDDDDVPKGYDKIDIHLEEEDEVCNASIDLLPSNTMELKHGQETQPQLEGGNKLENKKEMKEEVKQVDNQQHDSIPQGNKEVGKIKVSSEKNIEPIASLEKEDDNSEDLSGEDSNENSSEEDPYLKKLKEIHSEERKMSRNVRDIIRKSLKRTFDETEDSFESCLKKSVDAMKAKKCLVFSQLGTETPNLSVYPMNNYTIEQIARMRKSLFAFRLEIGTILLT